MDPVLHWPAGSVGTGVATARRAMEETTASLENMVVLAGKRSMNCGRDFD